MLQEPREIVGGGQQARGGIDREKHRKHGAGSLSGGGNGCPRPSWPVASRSRNAGSGASRLCACAAADVQRAVDIGVQAENGSTDYTFTQALRAGASGDSLP